MNGRLFYLTAVLRVSLVVLIAGAAFAQSEAKATDSALDAALRVEEAFSRVAEKTYPAVVCVTAYSRIGESERETGESSKQEAWRLTGKTSPFPGFRPVSSGSGFFLDDDGHILTCLHTLIGPEGELASVIGVQTVDLWHTLCRIVGTEPTLNIALLKLEVVNKKRPPKFKVPPLVQQVEVVRPGQWAISVGDPRGALKTYTVGTFTARPSRQCYQNDLTSTFIQTCMTVHPEAYGGPVVNIRGQVVGILTPRNPGGGPLTLVRGVEFVMPITLVKNIADVFRVKESFRSPWLGFSVIDMSARLAQLRRETPGGLRRPRPGEKRIWPERGGVFIDDVYDPSPAARAGIQPGDYLVSIDGHNLLTVYAFQKQLYLAGIGREVMLEMFRDGKMRALTVKIEARPKEAVTH